MAEEIKGERTETTVRKYDADGDLVSETVTVVTQSTPKADDQPYPGNYL